MGNDVAVAMKPKKFQDTDETVESGVTKVDGYFKHATPAGAITNTVRTAIRVNQPTSLNSLCHAVIERDSGVSRVREAGHQITRAGGARSGPCCEAVSVILRQGPLSGLLDGRSPRNGLPWLYHVYRN